MTIITFLSTKGIFRAIDGIGFTCSYIYLLSIHGYTVVGLIPLRAAMVFWSRAHRTARMKNPSPAYKLLSREWDELVRAQDALQAKLVKLVRRREEYQKELSKLERIANSTIPSAWKWPLTDNEFMLQTQEILQWREALVNWVVWIRRGQDASRLAWNCMRHERRKQDVRLQMMRRAGGNRHEWKRFIQAWMSHEGTIVQDERDAMALDKEILESDKRWMGWNRIFLEQELTLADSKMGGEEDEKGLWAQWKLWEEERHQMQQEMEAMEEEETCLHVHLLAPDFCRSVERW